MPIAKRYVDIDLDSANASCDLGMRLRACGAAGWIMAVFRERGLPELPDDAIRRIGVCDDLDVLRTWVRRASSVSSTEELFAEPVADGR